jgi:hypothetical protein
MSFGASFFSLGAGIWINILTVDQPSEMVLIRGTTMERVFFSLSLLFGIRACFWVRSRKQAVARIKRESAGCDPA